MESAKTYIIRPSKGWLSFRFRELWQHRELIYFLTWRDVKVRYKQTALGAAWAILQPVLSMLVFSLFFGRLAKIPSDGIPYPAFTYAALVPWTFFASALTQSSNSIVGSANLVTKVYFPRLSLPLATILAGVIDFLMALVLLIGMMAYYSVAITPAVLWLPVFVLLAVVTSLGVGLWLSALNVEYRDVRYVLPFLVQFWMFATPIAYPSSLLPEPWRAVYGLNPMVGVVEGFRWALFSTRSMDVRMTLASFAAAVVILFGGLIYFRRMEKALQTWFENPDRCLVIAEVALAHDGSLGTAHAYIDAASRAGADAVKFQTHIAEAESSPAEPWRVRFSPQDETRFDYWRRTAFTAEQWAGLARHARERNLIFLSSAFSDEAVDMLDRIGIPAWKIGAGEITNLPMLEHIAQTRKPVLLSAGMAGWADLDAAVDVCRRWAAPVAVFQCTTAYPCPPEKLGLNVIANLRDRYRCPVGLSDHSGTIFAGLAAVALGAKLIEVHVVFSKDCFGPDVPAAITIDELRQLTAGVHFLTRALENPVDKDELALELRPLRQVFGKSIVAARDLSSGTALAHSDLAYRKPGYGIPASQYATVLNRVLRKPVTKGSFLSEEDFADTAKAADSAKA